MKLLLQRNEKLKITLIISSLSAGGAERVMSSMANYWVGRAWSVTIITLADSADDFYFLEPDVKRVALNCLSPTTNIIDAGLGNLRRLYLLRTAISKSSPNVVVSFVDKTNVLTVMALAGLKVPVIISERIDPRMYPIGGVWSFLRKRLYSRASVLVVQHEKTLKWAELNWPMLESLVVRNPVVPPARTIVANCLSPDFNWCIAMGRLSDQKGFDVLINAFSDIANKDVRGNWRLVILGEGEERSSLESLVERLGLKERVLMPGLVKTPADYLSQADLFVMTSRYEGFPNALLEAMACGLPALSVDCDTGPRSIIRNEVDGLLVPQDDRASLVSSMKILMNDEDLREQYGARAKEVCERFSFTRFSQAWDDLVLGLCE